MDALSSNRNSRSGSYSSSTSSSCSSSQGSSTSILVEVVGGNWGGSTNFVLGTFPVLSQDSQLVVKHKTSKRKLNLSDLRHLILNIHTTYTQPFPLILQWIHNLRRHH